MKANDLRAGVGVRLDGKLYVVVRTDHVKPGKGPAYVQAKLRGISGGIAEKRFSSSDDVDDVIFDRREMEYLYSDNSGATFMDLENYDQVIVPEDVLGDALLYLAPNTTCTIVCHDEKPITLELPASVELTISDTPPGIKGATATNQLKEATCETGLKTRVPPFITAGEKIRISTEDGSYQSRVKEE
ncbi:MAG: elongation factor P [Phycisphaerales bacterium]|nr:MAG: elongation factor P [Phycisphaerales bacterium]